MTSLDDPHLIARLDAGGMAAQISGFPNACAAAWRQAQTVALPPSYRDVRSVVILGMGGSAISGDLARTLAPDTAALPIEVVRDYGLPGYVGAGTLAIAVSYSGNTEETLAAFDAARRKGACLIVIASGGALAARARSASAHDEGGVSDEGGIPMYAIQAGAQPRAALPHLYMPVLHALATLGIIRCPAAEVHDAVRFLVEQARIYAVSVPERANPAKRLARALQGRIVSVYGAGFLSEVARRWKTQINENSKQWAEFERLPEANHNAVVGYLHPAANTQVLRVAHLASRLYPERTRRRFQITRELLEAARIATETVDAPGPTPLAQQLAAILLGDYASYYLALLNGVDPTPVAPIDHLKAQLAQARQPDADG